jgi:hypothetical protein
VLLTPLFVKVPKKLVLLWKLLSNGDTKPKRKEKKKSAYKLLSNINQKKDKIDNLIIITNQLTPYWIN